MTADEWERIKALFEAALDRSPEERSGFLANACNGDEEIRREVERLLEEYDRADSFLETPPVPASLHSVSRDEFRTFTSSEIVAGRFRITRFIGQGGMGEVYEAEDLDLHERVALKTLRPQIAATPRSLETLKLEIHHARKVTHPNVNRIFDLERHRGPEGHEVAFLTMELLEGETLAERLKRVGRLTPSEAWPLIEQMAAGLDAAHEAGIVHRDFKPGNVILPGARAVITDFGLARAANTPAATSGSSASTTSGIFGTPTYMAPEQREGGPVTPATDVYALGVVLHEMLTGSPPKAPLLNAEVQELDPNWQAVILRCLEVDPAERFATASEVVTALRGERVQHSSGAWHRTALAAGLLLAVVAAFGWLFLQNRLPVAVLSNPVKLTNDVRQKGNAVAAVDASWLYFGERAGFRTVLAKASLSGGQIQQIRTPFRNITLLDSSPDQTALLVASSDAPYVSPGPKPSVWLVPTSGNAPRRLGDLTAESAAWSPDGRHIAYVSGPGLYRLDLADNNRHRIVTTAARIASVRWSPDGKTLAFETIGIDRAGLWKVRPDGSDLRPWEVRVRGLRARLVRGSVWTPDGMYLLARTDDDTWLVPQSRSFFSIWGGDPIPLNLGLNSALLCISKNGGTAYTISNGTYRNEFMTYDRRAKDFVRLAPLSGVSANTLAFSPDGQWTAYSEEGNWRLWRSKADGSSPLALTSSLFSGALPAWSPDGKQIAFMGNASSKPSRVYLIPRDGGEPRQLVPDSLWPLAADAPDHWQGGPAWSPDGKQIAFGENARLFPLSPSCAIHIFHLDTQRLSTIPHSEGLWTARWSPGGRYLAALTRDNQKLMLYDFRTQKWMQLDDGFIGENPAWSHDGRYLYYLKPYADPPEILRLRVPRGRPEQAADLSILDQHRGSFTLWNSLAPGDVPLLIRRDYNDDIYAYDLKLP